MVRTIIKYTDNKVFLDDAEVCETHKELAPGIYDMEFDRYDQFENFKVVDNPPVFPLLPSDELDNLKEYVETFLSQKYMDMCKKTSIAHRTGILLHGHPGIGKSNYVNFVLTEAMKTQKACVFSIDSTRKLRNIITQLKDLRAIQDTLFIVVLEEIDQLLAGGGPGETEANLKNFMDGITSVNSCLFLATTNYIELIPKSLKERPSRFRKVLEIKPSTDIDKLKSWLEQTYKLFLDDLTPEDVEKLHDVCLNKSIDEIKHALIDYKMGIHNLSNPNRLGFKKDNHARTNSRG